FHYFPSLVNYNETFFEAYDKANRLFADQLKSIIQPGDFIWVHDYQLMLLPEMIRQDFPEATIGFFLHIPFPSYEIFRLLPRIWGTSILNGMLGSNLVGFHTKEYCRYFLHSIQQTQKYKHLKNSIFIDKRTIRINVFPIGIDYEKFHTACLSNEVEEEKQRLRKLILDKKLVFSVDRLDYTKGLLARLDGIEYFLDNNPQWLEKVIFNMVVIPSRDSIVRYMKMKKDIESTVARINGKYNNIGWTPIIYQYTSLTFAELVALYDLSDAGLITPLRDGMNLVAKEYVACQVDNKGILILSEMTGAASELKESIIINPVDHKEISDAIRLALEMPKEEVESRILKMQKRISAYDVFTWSSEFFKQAGTIKQSKNPQ
ncbi:MAG TPA: trehalose-6-phosphate synthase, partial [Bacteroidales bacterium]|nr:trehalose-6-phosphate synthase [Bacteroidales bacterium]